MVSFAVRYGTAAVLALGGAAAAHGQGWLQGPSAPRGAIPAADPQGTDPAELTFWQSIQNSTDPAEYQAYLQAYPTGKFVGLARSRMQRLGAGAPPGAARTAPAADPAAAPPPPPEPEPTVEEKIVLSSPVGRVGELVKFTCVNFPKPFYSDSIVVVRAGSPDINPGSSRDDMKILARGYPELCRDQGYLELGPFAPGRYEVRYVTGLYNDDHTLEVRTRTPFSVR